MLHDLEKALTQLRQIKPLVLCLTNHVTMDFMANCLLSLGAAPIMTQDERELDELVRICQAVNLNIGTLDTAFIERANLVTTLAQKYNKPIILDPVGAGATQVRTSSSRSLMASASIIRGNASEILALFDNVNKTLGVEATHQVSDAAHSAIMLAREHQCTVVVSGERDFVTDGRQEEQLGFGSPLMPLVTGMGCALTAVIAAFKAIITDAYEAARLATAYYSLCGSLAANKTDKPGSFRTFFIDELFTADFAAMRSLTHVA
jgi:hydroxyethylthiazole kinase